MIPKTMMKSWIHTTFVGWLLFITTTTPSLNDSSSVSVTAFTPRPCFSSSPAVSGNHNKKSPLFYTAQSLLQLSSSSVASVDATTDNTNGDTFEFPNAAPKMGKVRTILTKYGMMAFILGMCITLPLTLLPQRLLLKFRLIDRVQSETMALWTGQTCAIWMLRLFPFCDITCFPHFEPNLPKPSIWVCNHTSMLDVFVLLAMDRKLRGKNKRPIKIVYWKQLEDNPITKLLFRQSGFIPVQMAANGHGVANDYDRASFKFLLQQTKQAFDDGFDVALLPEGQLNPTPEKGLLPVFSGAFTLAKLSKRPIGMMALHGVHTLWHPLHGMEPTGRKISCQVYPTSSYTSAAEFCTTFSHVVGEFGKNGCNVDNLESWLDGTAYQQQQTNQDNNGAVDKVDLE